VCVPTVFFLLLDVVQLPVPPPPEAEEEEEGPSSPSRVYTVT
jgi:hypothetical protein